MKKALFAAFVAALSLPVVGRASDAPSVAVVPYVAAAQVTDSSSRTSASPVVTAKNTTATADTIAALAVPTYQPPPAQTTISMAVAPVVLPADIKAPSSTVAPDDRTAWEVRASDENFRKLVARWAAEAGWKSLWDVPQDLPLAATAPFSGTFKDAVRGALASTELTDYPVHPCFYTNNVVRVVLYSVSCHKE